MEPLFYAVLVRLSPGYSPLIGRLHTRYSPVRRSPPMYCYIVLPLDLHVLSLSLAFILSQDQTLHGKSYLQKFYSGRVMCFMNLDSRRSRFTLATFCSFQYLKELFLSCFSLTRFKSESGCKDKTFFRYLPNLFQSFFKLFLRAS